MHTYVSCALVYLLVLGADSLLGGRVLRASRARASAPARGRSPQRTPSCAAPGLTSCARSSSLSYFWFFGFSLSRSRVAQAPDVTVAGRHSHGKLISRLLWVTFLYGLHFPVGYTSKVISAKTEIFNTNRQSVALQSGAAVVTTELGDGDRWRLRRARKSASSCAGSGVRTARAQREQ